MAHRWLACAVLVLPSACSEKTFHAESISLIAADSIDFPAGEEPSLRMSCEEGQVRAYVVMGSPGSEADSSRAVEIELDSSLACADSAL